MKPVELPEGAAKAAVTGTLLGVATMAVAVMLTVSPVGCLAIVAVVAIAAGAYFRGFRAGERAGDGD